MLFVAVAGEHCWTSEISLNFNLRYTNQVWVDGHPSMDQPSEVTQLIQ